MGKRFQKKVEDFQCDHCNTYTKGNGYTDHCPNCLWSKHVDINPSDRQSRCLGLMEPTGLKINGGKYVIHYIYQKCGYIHQVKANTNDNFESILKL